MPISNRWAEASAHPDIDRVQTAFQELRDTVQRNLPIRCLVRRRAAYGDTICQDLLLGSVHDRVVLRVIMPTLRAWPAKIGLLSAMDVAVAAIPDEHSRIKVAFDFGIDDPIEIFSFEEFELAAEFLLETDVLQTVLAWNRLRYSRSEVDPPHPAELSSEDSYPFEDSSSSNEAQADLLGRHQAGAIFDDANFVQGETSLETNDHIFNEVLHGANRDIRRLRGIPEHADSNVPSPRREVPSTMTQSRREAVAALLNIQASLRPPVREMDLASVFDTVRAQEGSNEPLE